MTADTATPAQRASTAVLRLPTQTEAEWQATVVQYARLRGYRVWHDAATNAPRRCPDCGAVRRGPRNPAGWPDIVAIKRPRVVFLELKAQAGRVSPEQQQWLDDLAACGQEVHVLRPSDWPDVERILR